SFPFVTSRPPRLIKSPPLRSLSCPSVGSAKGCRRPANGMSAGSSLTTGVGMLTSAIRLSIDPMKRELLFGLYAIGPPPKLKPALSSEDASGTRNAPRYTRLSGCTNRASEGAAGCPPEGPAAAGDGAAAGIVEPAFARRDAFDFLLLAPSSRARPPTRMMVAKTRELADLKSRIDTPLPT